MLRLCYHIRHPYSISITSHSHRIYEPGGAGKRIRRSSLGARSGRVSVAGHHGHPQPPLLTRSTLAAVRTSFNRIPLHLISTPGRRLVYVRYSSAHISHVKESKRLHAPRHFPTTAGYHAFDRIRLASGLTHVFLFQCYVFRSEEREATKSVWRRTA